MLKITPIPAFTDNYIWMISTSDQPQAWVVDPGDAAPVLAALQSADKTLGGVLITHHHPDHTGGLPALLEQHRIPVIGPPGIQGVSQSVQEDDVVEVLGHRLRVLETPGHTLDHIAFVSDDADQPLLFCGDTLFAAGCGRMFEGTAEQMHDSLSKLAGLPATTQVYCAHEYTEANLKFAKAVEADNQTIKDRLSKTLAVRRHGRPTVPSTLAVELASNPFLRCDQENVRSAAQAQSQRPLESPAEVFGALRGWKDRF
ncbi:MAG: hydroxyacylglutathione hydrolase [Pseudomonadota bacterium]|nr:hydroxyacylglutathione hydrolase [Pseudomonadota bacterium]